MNSIIPIGEYDPNEACPICLNDFGTSQAIFQTKCGHNFHNDCLQEYCRSNRGNIVCPVCRANVGNACRDTMRQGGMRKKRTKRTHIKKRRTKRQTKRRRLRLSKL